MERRRPFLPTPLRRLRNVSRTALRRWTRHLIPPPDRIRRIQICHEEQQNPVQRILRSPTTGQFPCLRQRVGESLLRCFSDGQLQHRSRQAWRWTCRLPHRNDQGVYGDKPRHTRNYRKIRLLR